MNGVTPGVTPGVPAMYIHFANFPSLMHVRFGAGGIGSRDCAPGRGGGKRKSMTSHRSILISWMSSDGGVGVAVATTVLGAATGWAIDEVARRFRGRR